MNAIHDAVQVDEIDMPATPERVWRAIRDATRRAVGQEEAPAGEGNVGGSAG